MNLLKMRPKMPIFQGKNLQVSFGFQGVFFSWSFTKPLRSFWKSGRPNQRSWFCMGDPNEGFQRSYQWASRLVVEMDFLGSSKLSISISNPPLQDSRELWGEPGFRLASGWRKASLKISEGLERLDFHPFFFNGKSI